MTSFHFRWSDPPQGRECRDTAALRLGSVCFQTNILFVLFCHLVIDIIIKLSILRVARVTLHGGSGGIRTHAIEMMVPQTSRSIHWRSHSMEKQRGQIAPPKTY